MGDSEHFPLEESMVNLVCEQHAIRHRARFSQWQTGVVELDPGRICDHTCSGQASVEPACLASLGRPHAMSGKRWQTLMGGGLKPPLPPLCLHPCGGSWFTVHFQKGARGHFKSGNQTQTKQLVFNHWLIWLLLVYMLFQFTILHRTVRTKLMIHFYKEFWA